MSLKRRLTTQNEQGDSDSLSTGMSACFACCVGCFVIPLYLAFYFAVSALFGVIEMLIGNAILRASHPSYTTDQNAAMIGALGGILASLAMALLGSCTTKYHNTTYLIFAVVPFIGFGATTGAIGTALVKLAIHRDIGELTIGQGTVAGVVGAAVLLAPTILLIIIILVLGVIGSGLVSTWEKKDKYSNVDEFSMH